MDDDTTQRVVDTLHDAEFYLDELEQRLPVDEEGDNARRSYNEVVTAVTSALKLLRQNSTKML